MLPTRTKLSFAHCRQQNSTSAVKLIESSVNKTRIITKDTHTKKKEQRRRARCNYIKNLKSLANADSKESFGAESLNREGNGAGDTSDSSVRFKYTHPVFLSYRVFC